MFHNACWHLDINKPYIDLFGCMFCVIKSPSRSRFTSRGTGGRSPRRKVCLILGTENKPTSDLIPLRQYYKERIGMRFNSLNHKLQCLFMFYYE